MRGGSGGDVLRDGDTGRPGFRRLRYPVRHGFPGNGFGFGREVRYAVRRLFGREVGRDRWPLGLGEAEGAQRLMHLTHQGGGLGPAAECDWQVVAVFGGEAEAVPRMAFGRDDLDGEHRLGRVAGIEGGDGGHGEGVAGVPGLLGFVGWRGEAAAEGGEDLPGEGRGEVWEGVHRRGRVVVGPGRIV